MENSTIFGWKKKSQKNIVKIFVDEKEADDDIESNAIAGKIVTVEYSSTDFDGLEPAKVFDVMKLFKPNVMPRELSSSYKSYGKLTRNQPKVVHDLYKSLSPALKQGIASKVASIIDPVHSKKSTSSKNQLARIAELREWPGAQVAWQKTGMPLTRPNLDAKNSHVNEEDSSPWDDITAIFNNRDRDESNQFRPQNKSVLYKDGVKTQTPAELSSTIIVTYVGDIDPDEEDIAAVTSAAFKAMAKGFCSNCARNYDNWIRSGSQNGCLRTVAGVEEYVTFGTRFDSAVSYAGLAMSVTTMKNLGKFLPQDSQRDSGILRPSGSDVGSGISSSSSSSSSVGGNIGVRRGQEGAAVGIRLFLSHTHSLTF